MGAEAAGRRLVEDGALRGLMRELGLGVIDALFRCGSVERASAQERCLLKGSEDVRAFPVHFAGQNMRVFCGLSNTQVACFREFAAGRVPNLLLPCVYWRYSGLDLAFSGPKAHFVPVCYFLVEMDRCS